MSETKTFEKGVAAPKQRLDGSGLRIAIVHTRWNYALVDQLYNKVYETLVKKYNVLPENIITVNTYYCSKPGLTLRIGYCLWSL
jgi:6,7-dimethyl-8-ribityllumazine synthase